jgi:sarcosine oxidase gamma subunit
VSALDFLSPSRCVLEALASPLARALADVDPAVVEDLSARGVVEIRGDVGRVEPEDGEELVRLTPQRGLLLTSGDPLAAVERLRAVGLKAYDVSAGYAAFAVRGEALMRRLTDLDLERLPAVGPLFLRVPALVLRDDGNRFRIYVAQELAHDVVMAVLDTARGLTPDVSAVEGGAA